MVNTDPVIKLSEFLSAGGVSAVIAILLVGIMGLIWERIRLIKKNDRTTSLMLENKERELESIKGIIDRYHQGNLDLSKTLSEIRVVLETIQRK